MKKRIPWNKGLTKDTDPRVMKYSLTKRGKKQTKEHIEKLLLSRKYHYGADHHMYKGEMVGYRALHRWIEKILGKAIKCSNCGKKEGRIHWSNIDHKYRRNINDYKQFCPACHGEYDTQLRASNI